MKIVLKTDDRGIQEIESAIDDMEDAIESLRKAVDLYPSDSIYLLPREFNNIRYGSAMDALFENIRYIPIGELENFVGRYKKTM